MEVSERILRNRHARLEEKHPLQREVKSKPAAPIREHNFYRKRYSFLKQTWVSMIPRQVAETVGGICNCRKAHECWRGFA